MIDAHQHYWHPSRGDHHWMKPDDPVLARPYHPRDLEPRLAEHVIEGTVLVQAAATIHETEYMLGIADTNPSVRGVVGWIDFEKPEDRAHLERLAKHPKFLGVRPMIQDIPDDDWMLRDDIAWGFEAVRDLDLTFDALGFPRHLANFHTILTRHPMRTVIDHCMKPQIREAQGGKDAFADWAEGMARIARDTDACCKLSGLVTEGEENVGLEDIRPFARHVLDTFGPSRVMWGSDWPVVRKRCEYSEWRAMAEELCAHLSEDERAEVFGGTARRFYRID